MPHSPPNSFFLIFQPADEEMKKGEKREIKYKRETMGSQFLAFVEKNFRLSYLANPC
jgi:hypothetical protein